jgi:hypothetical protein
MFPSTTTTRSRPPPDDGGGDASLTEPLLQTQAQHPTSDPGASDDAYLIKGVRGLWWRQSLLLLQAVLQLTLLGYALAADGAGACRCMHV